MEESACNMVPKRRVWKPPPVGWSMCNVAFEWDKEAAILGVAWVLRNHRGVVLMHSRRAFSFISSLEDARFITAQWAMESMTSLHLNRIIFAGDFKELFLAMKKPHLWPVIRFQTDELSRLLALIEESQLLWVSPGENRGAAFIAQSVTRQRRFQSYVANGHPEWLFEFFVNESRAL